MELGSSEMAGGVYLDGAGFARPMVTASTGDTVASHLAVALTRCHLQVGNYSEIVTASAAA